MAKKTVAKRHPWTHDPDAFRGQDTPKKPKAKRPYDMVGNIMAFEEGQLDRDGVVALFQHLVDTGLAWSLQGSYGRMAKALLDAGEISPARG